MLQMATNALKNKADTFDPSLSSAPLVTVANVDMHYTLIPYRWADLHTEWIGSYF